MHFAALLLLISLLICLVSASEISKKESKKSRKKSSSKSTKAKSSALVSTEPNNVVIPSVENSISSLEKLPVDCLIHISQMMTKKELSQFAASQKYLWKLINLIIFDYMHGTSLVAIQDLSNQPIKYGGRMRLLNVIRLNFQKKFIEIAAETFPLILNSEDIKSHFNIKMWNAIIESEGFKRRFFSDISKLGDGSSLICAYLKALCYIPDAEVDEFLSNFPSELDLKLTEKVKEFISTYNHQIVAKLLMADEHVFASKYKFFRNYPALFEAFLDLPCYSSEFKAAKITAFINAIPSNQLKLDDGFIEKFWKPVNVYFNEEQITSILVAIGCTQAELASIKFRNKVNRIAESNNNQIDENIKEFNIDSFKKRLKKGGAEEYYIKRKGEPQMLSKYYKKLPRFHKLFYSFTTKVTIWSSVVRYIHKKHPALFDEIHLEVSMNETFGPAMRSIIIDIFFDIKYYNTGLTKRNDFDLEAALKDILTNRFNSDSHVVTVLESIKSHLPSSNICTILSSYKTPNFINIQSIITYPEGLVINFDLNRLLIDDGGRIDCEFILNLFRSFKETFLAGVIDKRVLKSMLKRILFGYVFMANRFADDRHRVSTTRVFCQRYAYFGVMGLERIRQNLISLRNSGLIIRSNQEIEDLATRTFNFYNEKLLPRRYNFQTVWGASLNPRMEFFIKFFEIFIETYSLKDAEPEEIRNLFFALIEYDDKTETSFSNYLFYFMTLATF